MELKQAIWGRRSVRAYSGEAVDRATLDALIEAAIQAPNGMNRQPWAFGLIAEPAALAELDAQAKAHLLAQITDDSPIAHYRDTLSREDFHLFYGAPALIVIYTKPGGASASVDVCLAAQNLMLTAYEQGLGTCWIGFAQPFLNAPQTRAAMGVPEGYEAVAPIIVGRPAADFPRPERQTPEIIYSR